MHTVDPRPGLPDRLAWILVFALGCASFGSPAKGPPLAPCPDSPNCVSSLATDEEHRVEPFTPAGEETWPALRDAVAALPRTRIVAEQPGYLHAECTSRIFRFVDDLELLQRPGSDRVDVRSASRVGRGDMGVNRARVEALREALAAPRTANGATIAP